MVMMMSRARARNRQKVAELRADITAVAGKSNNDKSRPTHSVAGATLECAARAGSESN